MCGVFVWSVSVPERELFGKAVVIDGLVLWFSVLSPGTLLSKYLSTLLTRMAGFLSLGMTHALVWACRSAF